MIEPCHRNPTLSYTSRLEQRIKDLEAQLAMAKSDIPGPADRFRQMSPSTSRSHSLTPDPLVLEPGYEDFVSESFQGLTVDEKGSITYHGATSFFQLPDDRPPGFRGLASSSSEASQRRERLVANAWQQRALENSSDIPVSPTGAPGDLQTLGPYYSHTLMNAILSHSIRWGRMDPTIRKLLDDHYEGGVLFGKHVRSMLFDELSQGINSIPTVQTLLLLSAQECGVGNSAQAWTYSGLAFRIVDHLGICVDGQRYPGSVQLSEEDVELRHRIFWSCYFWDKMISLYLGRTPSLQHTSVSPPQIMFDDSSETESWTPFGVAHEEGWKYPPSPAYAISCFTSMCRLAQIFNEILVHMYDPVRPNSQVEMQECLADQDVALQEWWQELPAHLRIEPRSLPSVAPPSHIVTLNSLYHTFKILLYRPMLSQRTRAAEDGLKPIEDYLFGCDQMSRIRRRCGDWGTAFARLGQLKQINPVIGSALGLIAQELSDLGIDSDQMGLADAPATPPMSAFGVPLGGCLDIFPSALATDANPTYTSPANLQHLPFVESFGPEAFAIDPVVLQMMPSFEPLSVRMGGVDH
ncbi:hypothetical protein ACRALDRAFT_2023901 [Sodiomyces alcalophilus JCM 7366]|uniref:uncharacterized protein n=1 Tax=Sodiomyces alcalophilus JCM 7366 TaxID=591952 RepID=UPI0039B652EC